MVAALSEQFAGVPVCDAWPPWTFNGKNPSPNSLLNRLYPHAKRILCCDTCDDFCSVNKRSAYRLRRSEI
jgi:hypothetical protein